MPSKLPYFKQNDPVSAKTLNALVDRINALSSIKGDGAVRVQQGPGGVTFSGDAPPQPRLFQLIEDTPPGQEYVTAKELKWVNQANGPPIWTTLAEDRVFFVYDTTGLLEMAKWTKTGWFGTALWNASRGVWCIYEIDHVARQITGATPLFTLLEGNPQSTCANTSGLRWYDGLKPDGLPITLLNAPDQQYSNGGIYGNGGFSSPPTITFQPQNPPAGYGAATGYGYVDSTCDALTANDQCSIESAIITYGGKYYTSAPTVTWPTRPPCSDPKTGAQVACVEATGVGIVSNGQVTGITITNHGSGYGLQGACGGGYTSLVFHDNVGQNLSSFGYAASGYATVDKTCAGPCSITNVVLTNGGFGYRQGTTASTIPTFGETAATFTCTVTPLVFGNGPNQAPTSGGVITGIAINSAGSGFPPWSCPAVPAVFSGGQTWPPVVSAQAKPILKCGVLVDVQITDGGSGYLVPPLMFISGGGGYGTGCGTGFVGIQTLIDGNGSVTGIDYERSGGWNAGLLGGSPETGTSGQYSCVWRDDLDNSESWQYQIIDGPCLPAPGGATARAKVVNGIVVSISIGGPFTPTVVGSGYLAAPAMKLVSFAGGSGATAVSYLGCGSSAVAGVVVTNGGSGYSDTQPPLVEFSSNGA